MHGVKNVWGSHAISPFIFTSLFVLTASHRRLLCLLTNFLFIALRTACVRDHRVLSFATYIGLNPDPDNTDTMQSFTRIITFLLLLIVPAFASFADYHGDFVNSLEKRACGAIPCSGNATCENYSCGYCKADYCKPKTEAMSMSAAAAAATASSAAAAMATAMPASDAARNGMAGGIVVAAIGVAAVGLL